MSEAMFYSNSNMGQGAAVPAAKQESEAVSGGLYPKSNLEVVEVPRRGGAGSPRPADTVLVRDLGRHVASKVEAATKRGEGHLELGHYVGAAQGAGVLNETDARAFGKLVQDMAKATDQKVFFNREVRPILYNMKTAPRPKGAK